MLIGPSKNIANNEKGMYVGLKQPLGDGERCETPARAAAKETNIPAERSNNVGNKAFSSTDPLPTLFQQSNEYFNA